MPARLWFTRLLLRADAAQIIDDVPHVVIWHATLVALHLHFRPGAVADDQEDFAVRRAAIPFGVGEIRRVRVFGRHRTVALGFRPVTEPTVLRVGSLPGGDRRRR